MKFYCSAGWAKISICGSIVSKRYQISITLFCDPLSSQLGIVVLRSNKNKKKTKQRRRKSVAEMSRRNKHK